MRYLTTLAVFAAIVGLTTTQTINPDDVPISDRRQWCDAQQTQCPLICMQVEDNSGSPESNTCDPDTLVYSCVCGNGAAPNSSEFSQTIPYFICTWSNNECVDACGNNNICADNCRLVFRDKAALTLPFPVPLPNHTHPYRAPSLPYPFLHPLGPYQAKQTKKSTPR
ncbi:hypothetical protein BDY21DRAFT_183205 [Lineolata rhizophorae]|uniref:DUF7707 domain-containing protein n=1 Tax=Lineolata rhizophorae TaxID=578093 RepID=A0A6A6P8C6_9PEZI|nr:hypothetical protein BDY21DRAFT_183205 [Lineolata rhizophorae]